MPTKAKKNLVHPEFTQQEAKDLAEMLGNHINVLRSIGDDERAYYCGILRDRVVQASGKVPSE